MKKRNRLKTAGQNADVVWDFDSGDLQDAKKNNQGSKEKKIKKVNYGIQRDSTDPLTSSYNSERNSRKLDLEDTFDDLPEEEI